MTCLTEKINFCYHGYYKLYLLISGIDLVHTEALRAELCVFVFVCSALPYVYYSVYGYQGQGYQECLTQKF